MSTLVRWRPFQDMFALDSAFDRLFDETFRAPLRSGVFGEQWGLPVDVSENEDGFTVVASVPGIDPDDLDITLTDNVLTIRGETRHEQETDEDSYHLRERRYGRFSRSISLRVPVDADKVEATVQNGVLTVQVPKTEAVKPKRIAIKAGDKVRKLLKG